MIPENYCPWLYLSISHVWWLNELWFKSYIHKYTLSHVLTIIVTRHRYGKSWDGWKYKNLNILRTEIKKIIKKNLNLCLRWNILSSHRFVPEVTFNSVRKRYFHVSLHCTLTGPPLLSKAPSCVTETAYQNKTSLPYISPKLENVSFVKFSNYFGIHYLIWNLNTIFVKYLSKNRDMISALSRTDCVLYL